MLKGHGHGGHGHGAHGHGPHGAHGGAHGHGADPHRWVPVFASHSYARCADRAFVLAALGIPFDWRRRNEHGAVMLLLVPAGESAHALAQIVRYEREQGVAERPPPLPALAREDSHARVGVGLYVGVLLVLAFAQTHYLGGYDWLVAGRMQAGLVRAGEWWRTVTALTLHLDSGHLLGNLVFGSAFGYAASRSIGAGAAWLGILAAGAGGNLLNAWLQGPNHTAVGASTAVFGALGLVAAFQWRTQQYATGPGERWFRRIGPLVAGVALLAFLGTGDERTDVGAHVTGFLCGLLAGAGWSAALRAGISPRGVGRQLAMGATALVGVAIAWLLAFAAW